MVLGVPREGKDRQDRPRDADLIRHHKTCRRRVAEPSLVRRVTTARVFHESVEGILTKKSLFYWSWGKNGKAIKN